MKYITSIKVNIPLYWPIIRTDKKIEKVFSNGIIQFLSRGVNNSTILSQHKNGIWEFNWHYRNDPKKGIIEFQNDYPKDGIKNIAFWTGYVWPIYFLKDKEIQWGNYNQDVGPGSKISNQCMIEGPVPGFPGIGAKYGWQQVYFEDLITTFTTQSEIFYDVLQLSYYQSWDGGNINGAVLWMAPEIGIIQVQKIINGQKIDDFMYLKEQKII